MTVSVICRNSAMSVVVITKNIFRFHIYLQTLLVAPSTEIVENCVSAAEATGIDPCGNKFSGGA